MPHQEAVQARAASEPPRSTVAAKRREGPPPLDGQCEQGAPRLADALARVSLLPAAHAGGREAGAALPHRETAARSIARGAPAAPPGQVPCPLVEALLVEILASEGPPQGLSTCFTAGQFDQLRRHCASLMAERNARLPTSHIALSQTPGAAAVVAFVHYCFSAAWARCSDAAVEAARGRGIGWGARAALVHSFAIDLVDAGYLPGLPEARTWGQVYVLAAAEADAAASAVGGGAASPLSRLPALPPEIIGGAPGSPPAAHLLEALGPYALFARQRTPHFWDAAATQPVMPRTLAGPLAEGADAALPPYQAALASGPKRLHVRLREDVATRFR